MIYSVYQEALFDYLKNETGSVVIEAVAGAGKSSTIIEACRRLPAEESVLFLAFNVKIVEELKERLPKNVMCRTFNSAGWSAWTRFVGQRIKIDADKTSNIIRERFEKSDRDQYGSFVNKLVGLAKSTGLNPSSPGKEWFQLQEDHNLILSSGNEYRAIELAKKTLNASIKNARQVCDFDDQIYMPYLENIAFDKFNYLFVDELQDTSPIQAKLLKRMLKTNGRLVGVGDESQGIYGFRGAGIDSMPLITREFNAKKMPLSISYRCSKAVIREAQKYVPSIESFDQASEGTVEPVNVYNADSFKEDDAIICRNTAPLVEMAYGLIVRGKKVNFVGRDFGIGLKSLINNMDASSIDDLSIKLNAWLERETNNLINKNQESKISALEDKFNCIEVFINHLSENNRSIKSLIKSIDELFTPSSKGITLCTVHKSKGSEWNRVFILRFDLMPSPYAKNEWQKKQEMNLIYVAITRAKSYLAYINPKTWSDEPNLNVSKKTDELTSFNPFKQGT